MKNEHRLLSLGIAILVVLAAAYGYHVYQENAKLADKPTKPALPDSKTSAGPRARGPRKMKVVSSAPSGPKRAASGSAGPAGSSELLGGGSGSVEGAPAALQGSPIGK